MYSIDVSNAIITKLYFWYAHYGMIFAFGIGNILDGSESTFCYPRVKNNI